MIQMFTNGLYRFCEWVTRLAYLNILWIMFSLAGLAVFGVMPATVAACSVAHKWVKSDVDAAVFQTFWNAYKKEFWKANIIGLILLGIAVVFYIDFQIIESFQSQFSPMSVIFLSLLLLYGIVLLFIVPVYVHYDIPLLHTFKYAFLIGVLRPLHTLAMAAGAIGILYVTTFHAASMLFFVASAFCLVMTKLAVQAFESMDHRHRKQMQSKG